MRALMVLVVAMGVLIVAGVAGLIAVVTSRMASQRGPAPAMVLDEPAGTRIAGVAPLGDSLALQLQGGGADRVVVVDPHGRVTRRLVLAR